MAAKTDRDQIPVQNPLIMTIRLLIAQSLAVRRTKVMESTNQNVNSNVLASYFLYILTSFIQRYSFFRIFRRKLAHFCHRTGLRRGVKKCASPLARDTAPLEKTKTMHWNTVNQKLLVSLHREKVFYQCLIILWSYNIFFFKAILAKKCLICYW